MDNFLARARVVLSATVTHLTLLATIIAIVVAQLTQYVDNPVVAWVVAVLGTIATVITVATLIIRRVTEVLPAQRGVLPPPPPPPPYDGGAATNRGWVLDPESFVGWRPARPGEIPDVPGY